jgi:hypothetical protein
MEPVPFVLKAKGTNEPTLVNVFNDFSLNHGFPTLSYRVGLYR